MTPQTVRIPQFEENELGRYLCELEQIEPTVVAHLDQIIEQPTSALRCQFFQTFLTAFESEVDRHSEEGDDA